MKSTPENQNFQKSGRLNSLSDVALRLLEDISCMYQPISREANACQSSMKPPDMQELFECIDAGGLWLVAIRQAELGDAFCLKLAQQILASSDKPTVIYGHGKSAIRFAADLLVRLGDISPDAEIYGGKLSIDEVHRIYSATEQMSRSKIFLSSRTPEGLPSLIRSIGRNKELGKVHIVLIDNVQHAHALGNGMDLLTNLRVLKEISEAEDVPVIALYRLSSYEKRPEFILSKDELSQMEKLAGITNGIRILGGAPDRLKFGLPKLPRMALPDLKTAGGG